MAYFFSQTAGSSRRFNHVCRLVRRAFFNFSFSWSTSISRPNFLLAAGHFSIASGISETSRRRFMAGKRGKSKGQRDALGLMNDGLQAAFPGPGTACPISSPSQCNLVVPIQNLIVGDVENHKLVEGGPSICRDGDPSQILISSSDVRLVQAASSHNQTEAALH